MQPSHTIGRDISPLSPINQSRAAPRLGSCAERKALHKQAEQIRRDALKRDAARRREERSREKAHYKVRLDAKRAGACAPSYHDHSALPTFKISAIAADNAAYGVLRVAHEATAGESLYFATMLQSLLINVHRRCTRDRIPQEKEGRFRRAESCSE